MNAETSRQPGGTSEDQARRVLLILYLAGELGYLAWMAWAMLPEHRKILLKMRAARRGRLMTRAAARRAGAASMRAELATGQRSYTLPLALARLGDALDRAYERCRDVTS